MLFETRVFSVLTAAAVVRACGQAVVDTSIIVSYTVPERVADIADNDRET